MELAGGTGGGYAGIVTLIDVGYGGDPTDEGGGFGAAYVPDCVGGLTMDSVSQGS